MTRSHLDLAMRSFTVPGREAREFFREALLQLAASDVPFMVGGTYALARYMRIERATKDLDVFVRPQDVGCVLALFRRLGYPSELTFPHWLGKVFGADGFMDVIFSSGNGVARVDDGWFAHAHTDVVLGVEVQLCPPEEMIWSKAFVQERERFDGADVIHLFHHFGQALDWRRLVERFGVNWRVLFGHIVMFGFVYPDRRDDIPAWVTEEFTKRLRSEHSDPTETTCNGTLVSREQYLQDIESGGYADARLARGHISDDELAIWTAGIDSEE